MLVAKKYENKEYHKIKSISEDRDKCYAEHFKFFSKKGGYYNTELLLKPKEISISFPAKVIYYKTIKNLIVHRMKSLKSQRSV